MVGFHFVTLQALEVSVKSIPARERAGERRSFLASLSTRTMPVTCPPKTGPGSVIKSGRFLGGRSLRFRDSATVVYKVAVNDGKVSSVLQEVYYGESCEEGPDERQWLVKPGSEERQRGAGQMRGSKRKAAIVAPHSLAISRGTSISVLVRRSWRTSLSLTRCLCIWRSNQIVGIQNELD